MNHQNKTPSILQRVPAILAVTAASYGLTLPHAPGVRASTSSQSGATMPSGLQQAR